ncbi:MAG: enoyl-CoA hydratase/isomerase family protein [Proteobacteria bacterium]|nr:enoyl-CoA hydratase/isomerase family protein [Pseudomonadota bacterium]
MAEGDRVLFEPYGNVAVLRVRNPPVNALSAEVRVGLAEGVRRAEAEPGLRAVVIVCDGRTFFAGADITEFGKPPREPSLPVVCDLIEKAAKPVIAAMHGTALGGGLEVALACHGRVAVPSAKLGLPEVNLGLLPGAGGTQRLPRLAGVERALEMITSGKPIGAREALEAGIIDALVEEDGLLEGALAHARERVGVPLRRVRDLDDALAAARGRPEAFSDFRQANGRKFRGFRAPEACIQAVEAAVNLSFEEGLAVERRLFLELLASPESAAQRYAFFAERQAAKVPDLPEDTPTLPIERVGVLGAGTMGGGIAMTFLNAGLPVTLVETSQAALDRGVAAIRRNYEESARKGRVTAEAAEQRMGLLAPTLDRSALADRDLVIEAVFEDMAIKLEVFAQLDAVVKPGAILATNTSYLDVNAIAAATSRPESVIGLHFFSPANVMRLLEVVRGDRTAKPVIATAMQLAKRIGKTAVLVGVCHGFVGNRMLAARQREATQLILEGALPWDVDRVLYDFGLPMGPFAMADLAGLDIGWSRETSTGSTVREVLCEMDRRGQKTGAGFYDYDEARRATPSPVVEQVILAFSEERGFERRAVSDHEILQRCIHPMINEGARILEEGIASRASDIDVVWINGYGWPAYRGGPMFYADQIGPARVLESLQALQAAHGEQFKPAPLLTRLASEGRRFQDL